MIASGIALPKSRLGGPPRPAARAPRRLYDLGGRFGRAAIDPSGGQPALEDCPLRHQCPAYADPLIDRRRKGPMGLGCHGQTDLYRKRHCKTFRCRLLVEVMARLACAARVA